MLFKRSFSYFFLFITVMAGMQDNYGIYHNISIQDGVFLHALKLAEKTTERMGIDKKGKEKPSSGMLQFLKAYMGTDSNKVIVSFYALIAACIFTSIYYTNDLLKKNNIWKSAVF